MGVPRQFEQRVPDRAGLRRGGRLLALAILLAGWELAPGAAPACAVGSWQALGPDGGVALGLAVDPTAPGTVYAAAGAGGLFKTVDGGRSWAHSDSGLLPGRVTRVVIDPATPANLYAGVAPLIFGVDGGGGGIFKSTDAGATWVPAGSGIGNDLGFVNDLALDPQTPTTLYAAAYDRVFKSTDGAASWFDSGAGLRRQVSVLSVAVDPVQPAVIYAGTSFGVWKSVDAGASWQPARAGMGRPSVVALAVDPGGNGTVHAAARPSGSSSPRGLFVSTDGGANWTARPLSAGNPAASCVVVSPGPERAVYACGDGEGLFRSLDGGGHWQPIDRGLQAATFASLAVAPSSPNRLYAGVGGPASNAGPVVYRSLSAGAIWRPFGSGIDAIDLSSLAVDPTHAGTVYAGSRSGGVLKTTDDGGSWSSANRGLAGALAVSALAIDPLASQHLYVETDGGFFTSHDAAARWVRPGAPFPGAPPLVVDPQTPATVYTTAGSIGDVALYKSHDGGATWRRILLAGTSVPALTVAPSSPATVYVATQQFFFSSLSTSHDSGATFREDLSIKGGIPLLAVDPADANTLYFEIAASSYTRTGLFAGPGFRLLLAGDEPAFCMVIDPADPAVLYAGTFDGVLVSRDRGVSWSELAPGLPRATVTHLAFGPGGGSLYAMVVDNGVYRIALYRIPL